MTTSIRFQNALFPAILDVLSASRKLRLGPGFEIVCQSIIIRRISVLNR